MKQVNLTITFDEEKLSALKRYMGKKELDLDREMTDALVKLYEKYVPAPVREYIDESDVNAAAPNKSRRSPKPVTPKPAEEVDGVAVNSKDITLWIDERWYDALSKHLKDETLEEHLENVLDEMCNQLPQREYERISTSSGQSSRRRRRLGRPHGASPFSMSRRAAVPTTS